MLVNNTTSPFAYPYSLDIESENDSTQKGDSTFAQDSQATNSSAPKSSSSINTAFLMRAHQNKSGQSTVSSGSTKQPVASGSDIVLQAAGEDQPDLPTQMDALRTRYRNIIQTISMPDEFQQIYINVLSDTFNRLNPETLTQDVINQITNEVNQLDWHTQIAALQTRYENVKKAISNPDEFQQSHITALNDGFPINLNAPTQEGINLLTSVLNDLDQYTQIKVLKARYNSLKTAISNPTEAQKKLITQIGNDLSTLSDSPTQQELEALTKELNQLDLQYQRTRFTNLQKTIPNPTEAQQQLITEIEQQFEVYAVVAPTQQQLDDLKKALNQLNPSAKPDLQTQIAELRERFDSLKSSIPNPTDAQKQLIADIERGFLTLVIGPTQNLINDVKSKLDKLDVPYQIEALKDRYESVKKSISNPDEFQQTRITTLDDTFARFNTGTPTQSDVDNLTSVINDLDWYTQGKALKERFEYLKILIPNPDTSQTTLIFTTDFAFKNLDYFNQLDPTQKKKVVDLLKDNIDKVEKSLNLTGGGSDPYAWFKDALTRAAAQVNIPSGLQTFIDYITNTQVDLDTVINLVKDMVSKRETQDQMGNGKAAWLPLLKAISELSDKVDYGNQDQVQDKLLHLISVFQSTPNAESVLYTDVWSVIGDKSLDPTVPHTDPWNQGPSEETEVTIHTLQLKAIEQLKKSYIALREQTDYPNYSLSTSDLEKLNNDFTQLEEIQNDPSRQDELADAIHTTNADLKLLTQSYASFKNAMQKAAEIVDYLKNNIPPASIFGQELHDKIEQLISDYGDTKRLTLQDIDQFKERLGQIVKYEQLPMNFVNDNLRDWLGL